MDTNPLQKKSFEECIDVINAEIAKRKSKWTLSALAWIDYDDVSQILRLHIYKKWNQYDPAKPLANWLNKIISNQIKNLIRNNYGNFSRPCLKCAAFEGENLCAVYTVQSSACEIYKKWEATKKNAHNIKITTSLDAISPESINIEDSYFDVDEQVENIDNSVKKMLKEKEYKFYRLYFIEKRSDKYVAEKMGFITSEKNKCAGYRQIKNLSKVVSDKVKDFIKSGKIDIY